MRNGFRRLIAMVLLVCSLCSFVVPATFADNTGDTIIYDFKLYNNPALLAVSNAIAGANTNPYSTKYDGTNRLFQWMFENYGTDALNWNVEDSQGRSTNEGSYDLRSKNFEFRGAGNQGLRLWLTDVEGQYGAVRIKVPASGTYAVSLNGSHSTSPLKGLDVYVFPATTQSGKETVMHKPYSDTDTVTAENQIATYLTDANKLGTAAGMSCDLGEKAFATAGDYIVVFKVGAGGIGGDYAYLSNLQLKKVSDEVPETTVAPTTAATVAPADGLQDQVYDFKLYNYEALGLSNKDVTAKDTYDGATAIYNWLFQNYGTAINWGMEDSFGRPNHEGNYANRGKNFAFRGKGDQGLRLWLTDTPGNYAAIRFSVPAAGSYNVNVAAAGKNYLANNLDVYIFPAVTEYTSDSVMHNPYNDSDPVLAEHQISTYLTAENKVGTVNTSAAALVSNLGQWSFPTEGDYIVVFQVNEAGIGGDYAYLGSLTLLAPEVEEETTAGTTAGTTEETTEATTEPTIQIPEGEYKTEVYDFKLYNHAALSGISGTDTTAKDTYDGTNAIYKWIFQNYGKNINWGIEDSFGRPNHEGNYVNRSKNFAFRGKGDQGVRIWLTNTVGNYAAVRIRVPAAGSYDVKVAAVGKNYLANNLDVYIFPANTNFTESTVMHDPYNDSDSVAAKNQITTYLTPANKIGTVKTSATRLTCNVGEKTFPTAGDYIVVFQVADGMVGDYAYLSSLTLAVPSAEDETTAPTEAPTEETTRPSVEDREGFYNLALYNNKAFADTFNKAGVPVDQSYTKACYECKKPLLECFAEKYAKGELNWQFEGMSFVEMWFMASSDYGMRLRYDADAKGEKIYLGKDEKGKDTYQETAGNWVAFRLKVDKAGEYYVSVGKSYAQLTTANLYIFPATAEKMSKDALTAAMVDANLAGALQIAKDADSAKAGQWTFTSAGEYIFLLKTTGSTTRLFLNSIELSAVPEDKPVTPKKENIYDFDMVGMDKGFQGTGLTGRYNDDAAVRAYMVLEQLYAEGKIQWKYETVSPDAPLASFKFEEGRLRYKQSTNARELSNQWYAFRIKNPGTATYDIRLTSSDKSKVVANIYMIPANTGIKMTESQVQEGMTKENLLVKGAIFNAKDTFYLGEYTFGMKEEYVLVFEFTKGTLLYLNNIRMTLDDTVADTEVKVEKVINGTTYNFGLLDPMDGYISKSKYTLTEIKSEMMNLWRSGKINWRFESACDYLATVDGSDLIRFYKDTGMRTYNQSNNWSAYRIKSPGSGTFTLSLEHSLQYSSGTLAIYILPGDTENVEKGMDPKNRVGKVALYNDGNTTETETGVTTYFGYWDFEAGKEYIVVFESYVDSPYKAGYSYVDVSKLFAERGKIDFKKTEEERKVNPVTITEHTIPLSDALHTSVVTEVYGHDYFFLAVEGGVSLVYDLDTGELVDSIHTGYSRAYQMEMDQDGILWIAGSSKYLVRYDPYTQQTHRTPNFLQSGLVGSGCHALCPAPDGKIWFVTFGGDFGYYNYERDEYFVYEVIEEGAHPSGMVYLDGYLYFNGNNNNGQWILKYDAATGKRVASLDITDVMETTTSGYLNNMSILGSGEMIMGGTTGAFETFFAFNPETMEIITDHGLFAGTNMGATDIIDGKQYFALQGLGLYEYDVETQKFSKTPGFGNSATGFKSEATSLVTLDGEELLFTYTGSGGIRMYNLETKEVKSWDTLIAHSNGAANIHSLVPGEEGDERLYIGGYNTPQVAIYDINEGKVVSFIKSNGQGDSGVWYEGKFYVGNYSSTTINELPVEEEMPYPAENEVTQRVKLDHEVTKQKRIHTLCSGDGYIFGGSIPDTGYYGGSIVVYNTKTGKWYYDRTAAPDRAVTKVAYSNKVLYAATSNEAGTNTTIPEPEGLSSVIVAYDYENKQLLGTLDPRDYIKGLPSQIKFISGLEVDPVVEGRLWAVVSETLFCFEFDRETGKFNVQEVLSFDKTKFVTSASRSWWNRAILYDVENNYMYFSFDTNGGFRRMTIADWNAPIGKLKIVASERIMGDTPIHYTMAHDGDVYYGSSETLKMLPLNITDEEWAIAEAVDEMITSLGEITVESEAAVKSARSAYDNLSWRYKALIQNLDLLKEAEADLLECQIDALVLDNVTADSLQELQVYQDTYEGFEPRYQTYVKNYDTFLEAYNKASALNDERVAKALQDRIDALKAKFPLTLNEEEEVKAIRADYDALSGPQRMLVDISILEDAEAQIKVLRAELVKRAEELIQAIPNEITFDAEPAIMAAKEVVDLLYTNELKQISYAKFDKAEAELRSLKNAKAAAEEVDALIDAIGIVTLGDKARIAEARKAYNALNETGKSFVTNAKKLQKAEWILGALQTWMIPAIVAVVAGAGFCVVWFTPSLRSKVFKSKKKEKVDTNAE